MPLTCVLVDDSPEFLTSAARLLEAEGMQVIGQRSTGDGALEFLASHAAPDVILVDVELGDEDGVSVAAQLADHAPSSTVILISSRDRDELREALGPSTTFSFIAKRSLSVSAIADLLG